MRYFVPAVTLRSYRVCSAHWCQIGNLRSWSAHEVIMSINNACTADLILSNLSKPDSKLYQVTLSVRGFLLRGFGLWHWPLTASNCMFFFNQDVNSLLQCKVAYMNLPIISGLPSLAPTAFLFFPA